MSVDKVRDSDSENQNQARKNAQQYLFPPVTPCFAPLWIIFERTEKLVPILVFFSSSWNTWMYIYSTIMFLRTRSMTYFYILVLNEMAG